MAKYNNKIIGALEISDTNHIQSFFVKNIFQNKGIGKMLLNHSIDFFRKRGLK
jgi:GNAT superfamily N-acetyltransferase